MRHLLAVLALIALSLPSPARAGQPIVLEAYVGERPADADPILAPVIDELAKNRFVYGPAAVGSQLENGVSRPAGDGSWPEGFADAVAKGHDLWMNGKFNEAASVLGPIVEAARRNPGEFARDPNGALQPQLQKALIALSLSQLKLGDRGAARQTMARALLGNPELKISRGMYGQEGSELFDEVLRELTERRTGKVTIEASSAGIYVNERLVGVNRKVLYLLPGEYRVIALFGDEVSRAHKLVVAGGDIQELRIDPAFDRAVHTGPGWTGFLFPASTGEHDELRLGATFAREIDAAQVVVIGIDTVRGRRMIRGALINKGSEQEFRAASIPLDANPSEEQRRNLARFLNGGPPTPDLIVGPPPRPGGAERPDAAGTRRWGGWKYLTGGAAIGAGVAGGVLLAYDGRCSRGAPAPGVPCADSYHLAPQGWATVGGAVVLAGITAYLVVTERRGRANRSAYLAPAPGGALAGYAATF